MSVSPRLCLLPLILMSLLLAACGGGGSSGVPADNYFFFSGTDGITGRELWRTDGTANGTRLVRDIWPGSDGSDPLYFRKLGNNIYFSAHDGVHDRELWVSNGTAGGTRMVADVHPDFGSEPLDPFLFNGDLYFLANDGIHGYELWRADGSAAGASLVRNINTSGSSGISYVTEYAGRVYFSAFSSGQGAELWRSDGTHDGTELACDINPGVASSEPRWLVVMNNLLYFAANDGTSGRELWQFDGESCSRVHDISPGAGSSNPEYLTLYRDFSGNPRLYFTANDGTGERDLWSYGVGGVVRDGFLYAFSAPADLTVANDVLYFAATTAVHGRELWRFDTTLAGTGLVRNIHAGANSSNPQQFSVMGGELYFVANDGSVNDLWKTDGSEAGTIPLTRLASAFGLVVLDRMTVRADKLFFFAQTFAEGREVWVSDGTEAGTRMVVDLCVGSCSGATP
jgi:large repetitive protein